MVTCFGQTWSGASMKVLRGVCTDATKLRCRKHRREGILP